MYFRPEIAYDEDGEAYLPMSPGNIACGLAAIAFAFIGTAMLLLGIAYNSAMWVINCIRKHRETEENRAPLPYQYDRHLSARDPELVDRERGWVRYTTAERETPDPKKSHLFDYGNGEKGFWKYNA